MTAEASTPVVGYENEACHISTTKPQAGRWDKSVTPKSLILSSVGFLVAVVLIGFMVWRTWPTPEEESTSTGLSGHTEVIKNSSSHSQGAAKLLDHEATLERITAQYTYTPEATDVKTNKLILIWSDWSDHMAYDYNKMIITKFCKYTRDKNMINNADAVIFRNVANDDELPDRTNYKQIWIFNHRKPDSFNFTKHKHSFNWTATHRFDSDVPHLYDYLWRIQAFMSDSQLIEKYIQPKYNGSENTIVKVAMFLTDCNNTDIRKYISELNQYVKVDCYCTHGMLNGDETFDPPMQRVSEWFKKYSRDYMFYLAFEEKQCEYFITDQFFGALRNNVVPIVRGNKAIYEKLAPKDSYIHISSLNGTKEMAEYLEDLAADNQKLVKYFRWRMRAKFTIIYWYTQLCNALQVISSKDKFTIDNINDKISTC